MRQRILLLFVLVTLLGSCTTMYKSGQTPDDVYYSPGREVPAYVETENNRDSRNYTEDDDLSDRYLRMKSTNRNRWSAFDDDFMYWNNSAWNNPYYYNTMRPMYPYGGGSFWNFNLGFYSGFNPYYSSWYNPFCTPGYYGRPVVIVTNPKAYTPRSNGNLSAYSPRYYSTDPKTGTRTYNISGTRSFSSRSGSGGSYYTPSSGRSTRTYGTDSYSSPSRSFNNSSNSSPTRSSGTSSPSRSSGGSGGGSAPVRSFPRGGG